MKTQFIKRTFIINLAIILIAGVIQIQAQTSKNLEIKATVKNTAKTEKENIEAVVKNYLLTNPEIIREAMQALQLKEARAKEELVKQNLKKFETEIFADPNSPTAGYNKAGVSVVAFFDYNCGYCKSSLPLLKELLANDSSIRVIYKEYPILSQSSQLAAKAALAAHKQGKYVEFHEALVVAEQINEDSIKSIAKKLELDYEKLRKDMTADKTAQHLQDNYNLANSLNIQGTPAYIIGTQVIPGAIDLNSLTQIVEQERAKLSSSQNAAQNSVAK